MFSNLDWHFKASNWLLSAEGVWSQNLEAGGQTNLTLHNNLFCLLVHLWHHDNSDVGNFFDLNIWSWSSTHGLGERVGTKLFKCMLTTANSCITLPFASCDTLYVSIQSYLLLFGLWRSFLWRRSYCVLQTRYKCYLRTSFFLQKGGAVIFILVACTKYAWNLRILEGRFTMGSPARSDQSHSH